MVLPQSRLKIAFLCLPGLASFLGEIVSLMQARYQVRTCFSDNPQEIAATVAWADVVWLEWANALAVGLTKNAALLEGKRVICRLHSYEAFEDDITEINWSRIDELICVAPHILGIVKTRIPDLERRCGRLSIIPNGINLDKLPFQERRKGFNLAYLGYVNYKKGPMLLLQVLKELVRVDSRYHLTIGGQIQDQRFKLYFDQMIPKMGLTPHISFDGWIDDVNGWLADKDYILCTSLLESQGMGLMEAMGCGIKPIIHNFVGAWEIYPQQYLWNTIHEAVNLIHSTEYDSSAYRNWIQRHYGLAEHFWKMENVVVGNQYKGGPRTQPERNAIFQMKSKDTRQVTSKPESVPSPPVPPQVQKMLERCVQPGMQVLDIGCGTGAVAQFMGTLGAKVTSVDTTSEAIAEARRNHAHENVDYQLTAYDRMELPVRFDLVTIINALQTVTESALESFIQTIARHMSPKAVVYLNIKDGRYLQYLKKQKETVVDPKLVAHTPDAILKAFASSGFHAYHINFYGNSKPLTYNEFLFTTPTAFEQSYATAS